MQQGYLKPPPEAALAVKGAAKGRKAEKKGGKKGGPAGGVAAAAGAGGSMFRLFTSPTGLQVGWWDLWVLFIIVGKGVVEGCCCCGVGGSM